MPLKDPAMTKGDTKAGACDADASQAPGKYFSFFFLLYTY